MSKKYAIIILAAGNSSRLGRPKQIEKFNGKSLLGNTIDCASKVSNADVHVVLGAFVEKIINVTNPNSQVYTNTSWQKGMGNSIAFGINQIKDLDYDAAILSVCDQPYLKTKHFEQLIKLHNSDPKNDVIISNYKNGKGPPSLFSKEYFGQLAQLDGNEGAMKIVKSSNNIKYVQFTKGFIDIDSSGDILTYLKK